MTEHDWHAEYSAACDEMRGAQEQCRIAEKATALAAARYGKAESELNRLFRERVTRINGIDGEHVQKGGAK